MSRPLYLHEEFLLLGLCEDSGTVTTSESIEYPLAAALLTELMLQKRIALSDDGEKRVRVTDITPLNEPLLDEALRRIRERQKSDSISAWVERLAGLKDIMHRTARQLCVRGILRADEDKVLKLFTRKIYPEINPEPERRIVERMRATIFGESDDIDPRDAVLIALARQTHLLDKKFDKEDLKSRKERIEQITEGSLTAGAAKEVVDATNTVILVAVMIPILFD
jgi:hypothetical protein